MRVVAGDPVGSIYKEYARTHVKGQGQPYKVEGIGGDKIPTSLDFDRGRRVDHGLGRRRLPHRAAPDPRGGDLPGRLGRASTCSRPSTWRGALDDPQACVVTILCDTGERYLSKLYDDNWMRENQMLEAERVTAGQLLRAAPGRHRRRSSPWRRWPTCARP